MAFLFPPCIAFLGQPFCLFRKYEKLYFDKRYLTFKSSSRDYEEMFSEHKKNLPEWHIFMQLIELTESERTGENVEDVTLLLNDKTFVTWVCKVRGDLQGQHQSDILIWRKD